ncbi:MAG: bi-domain-containing oxidoreductase [Gemmatimonadota bacterium]
MKAVLQNFRTGDLSVSDVPPPVLKDGGVLVRNAASLISAGTEKAAIELARMNPLQKARTRPDLVKKVLNRAGQEGLLETAQTVMNLVSAPLPLGYSCAGVVEAVGDRVTDLQVGQRVACGGYGYANHADVVYVPRNLTVPIPDGVSFEEASFVTVGAISVQGVRQADVAFGESVVIIGLGLLGQLTAQICAAAGCRVFGLDLEADKVDLALRHGMDAGAVLAGNDEDVIARVLQFTRGRGADAILITAGTSSNHPIELSAELARDRARVVVVGDARMDVPRWKYYKKELEVRLARSYGPGRYDAFYEERGQDYPIGYVRWTENRNMESFLDLVGARKVDAAALITHRYGIEDAEKAYGLFLTRSDEPYVGILLEYDTTKEQPATVVLSEPAPARRAGGERTARIGVIGAGQFAQGVLLPRLRGIDGATIAAIATGSGTTARPVAEKNGAAFCTSDYRDIVASPDVDAVLIATRHDLHAPILMEAIAAGKHVFVEKPIALTPEELDRVERAVADAQARRASDPLVVMVGLNRRYSPAGLAARDLLRRVGAPAVIDYRVNAGAAPADSWVHDPSVGGGRIVGEMCHSIDLVQFIVGAEPTEVFARATGAAATGAADPDTVVALLTFPDGTVATVRYLANGEVTVPKERAEIFCGGHVMTMDNFRGHRIVGPIVQEKRRALLKAEKGRKRELEDFVAAVRGGPLTFDWPAAVASMRTVFAVRESLRTGAAVRPGAPAPVVEPSSPVQDPVSRV